jgi:hypothetical protein
MNRVNNLAGRTKKKLPSNLKSNKSKRNAFMSSLYPSKRSKSNIKSPSALRELILKKVKEGVKGLSDLESKVKQTLEKKKVKVPSNLYSIVTLHLKELMKEGIVELKRGKDIVFKSNKVKKQPSSLRRSMNRKNINRSRKRPLTNRSRKRPLTNRNHNKSANKRSQSSV